MQEAAPDARASALERLNIARQSSDLGFDRRHRKDVDYVAAAGIAARRSRVGGALMRLHDRKLSSLNTSLDAVASMVRNLNVRERWRLNTENIWKVAAQALAHHLDPVCQHCKGQGYLLIPGSTVKSNDVCPHCDGTARHPLPRRNRHAIERVISELQKADSTVEETVARVVR